MKHLELIRKSFAPLGPVPDGRALGLLSDYLELLIEWTGRVDLVSPGTPQELIERHLCDAFASWRKLEERELFGSGACLDVGSGAGLPGVAFAILSPSFTFHLCEPRQKRAVFLQEVRRRLGLKNVTVVNKRLDDVTKTECPGTKLATFRALKPEPEMAAKVRELSEPGAVIAFITGARSEAGAGDEVVPYSFAGDTDGRAIILIKIS